MCDDLKFTHNFWCTVSGPSGYGKSSFWLRLIQNLDAVCTEQEFDGEKNAVPTRQQLPENMRFNESVPEDFGNATGEPCLVILDDL